MYFTKSLVIMSSAFNNPLIKFVFYGNYFYGICAIALSIEATLQQHFPLNNLYYFLALFCATVVYYSHAYITEIPINSTNERTLWYKQNKKLVVASQVILTLILCIYSIIFLQHHWLSLLNITRLQIILILIFPLVGLLYYGVSGTRYSLRNIGWLKPFVIGFAWAGLVTFYPIIFNSLAENTVFELRIISLLLFLKNFMFVSVLCIMFDIKDYVSDKELNLHTFAVKFGLEKTILFVILPLCTIGLGTFMWYGVNQNFHLIRIILNVLPFLLVLLTAYSLHLRRSILYYLVVVDGLMLLKGICGSVGMIFFN